MELYKFHILQGCAGTICHSESVGCRAGWVCGFAIELSRAARGEDCVKAPDYACAFFAVPADDAKAFVVGG